MVPSVTNQWSYMGRCVSCHAYRMIKSHELFKAAIDFGWICFCGRFNKITQHIPRSILAQAIAWPPPTEKPKKGFWRWFKSIFRDKQ